MRIAMLLPAMLALAATDTGPLPESLDPSLPGAPRRRSRRPGPTPDADPEPSDATEPSDTTEPSDVNQAETSAHRFKLPEGTSTEPADSGEVLDAQRLRFEPPMTSRSDSRPPMAWLLAEEKRQRKAGRRKKTWTGRVL